MKINLVNENFKSNYLENLLRSRGVDDIKQFINPPSMCLADPADLDNINLGVQWLEETLAKPNSRILIIVDSDVDGYTSAAIVWNYIRAIAPNQDLNFILHEHKQHGLEDHIENLLNQNESFDLIILPDSSSNDFEHHEKLGSCGMRCLVLDHHDIDAD